MIEISKGEVEKSHLFTFIIKSWKFTNNLLALVFPIRALGRKKNIH